jgi:fructoselysine-6-P-deglycase FrlB-like protein
MPGTVESMGLEIKYQVEDIPAYIDYLSTLPPPDVSELNGCRCVFTGAGDSYAAALAAEIYSGYRSSSTDPYELSRSPWIVDGKHLYLISVSGRTRSNIEAARMVKSRAAKVTAITAGVNSILARSCDDLIELKYRSSEYLTPGTSSFTMSLLASYSRINPLPRICNLQNMYDEAKLWAAGVNIDPESTTFIVGTGLAYPFAIYCKAKILEVFGSKAQAQLTEQFSHMELFSLTRRDLTIILQDGRSDRTAENLHRLLSEKSYRTVLLNMDGRDRVEASIRMTLHLQLLVWMNALRLGMRECAFSTSRELLGLSDEMIYYRE